MSHPDLIRSLAAGLSHVLPGAALRRTLEVRWFYEGEPSAEAVEWFEGVCGPVAPGTGRDDVYLFSERPGLNIKQREGRLEVKRRPADGRAIRFTGDVEGLAERWDKWVMPWPARAANGGEGEGQDEQWIVVGKSRRICRLEVGETISRVQEGAVPPRSCGVELTRLSVHGRAWWSISFEASAAESELDGTFLRAANYAFAQHAPPRLDLACSYSYPQWLMNLSK